MPVPGSSELDRQLAERGIHRIEVPTPWRIGSVNCYLVEDAPLTLIDAGANWGASLAALEHGLAIHGHTLTDIELVVLTHQHTDHIGLAQIVAHRSGADVMAIDTVIPWLRDFRESSRRDDAFAREEMRRHGASDAAIKVARAQAALLRAWASGVDHALPLVPGSQLRLRDRTFDVMHRPGHSPSDLVLHDAAGGLAFVGDHLLERRAPSPLLAPPAGEGAPRPRPLVTYVGSLAETAKLPDDVAMLPGHGCPFTGHREIIRQRLDRIGARSRRVRDLVGAGRGETAFELARAIRGEAVEYNGWAVMCETLGYLDVLVDDGALRESADAGGRIRYTAAATTTRQEEAGCIASG